MAQSITEIYIHLNFSTKKRVRTLDTQTRKAVLAYITGIMKTLNVPVLQAGGYEEHVHILFRMPKDITFMDLLRTIKSRSSRYVNEQLSPKRRFRWQTGYWAASVSPGSIDRVIRYIANQEQHHQRQSYEKEVRKSLREAKVKIDERYFWD